MKVPVSYLGHGLQICQKCTPRLKSGNWSLVICRLRWSRSWLETWAQSPGWPRRGLWMATWGGLWCQREPQTWKIKITFTKCSLANNLQMPNGKDFSLLGRQPLPGMKSNARKFMQIRKAIFHICLRFPPLPIPRNPHLFQRQMKLLAWFSNVNREK